jgi:hypothetical protein
MAPKPARNVSAEAQAAFADDTSSMMAPPVLPPRVPKRAAPATGVDRRLDAAKKARAAATRPAANVAATIAAEKGKKQLTVAASGGGSRTPGAKGKTRFFRELRGLTQPMVDGRLLGFGALTLGSKPGDYDRMQMHTGSSSSGETSASCEETYRIARSLGFPSDSQLLSGVDYRAIGVLPPSGEACRQYSDLCERTFRLPEAERDLLAVDRSFLSNGLEHHLFNVSLTFAFCYFGLIKFSELFVRRCVCSLSQALLIKRSMDQQVEVHLANLEDDVKKKDEKIVQLRSERNAAVEARKEAERKLEEAAKERDELRKEVEALSLSSKRADVAFRSDAEELAKSLRFCLRTIGCDISLPSSFEASAFLGWLRREVSLLEGYMTHGRDMSAVVCIKALCSCLLEAHCDHLSTIVAKDDPFTAYWTTPASANAVGGRFFEDFWAGGGNDLALVKAAMARAVVCFRRFCCVWEYCSPL